MEETKRAAQPSPITVGSLFADTFRAFSEGVATYLPISILLHVPLFLLASAMLSDRDVDPGRGWGVAELLVGMLVQALLAAAIAYGAVMRMRGSAAGPGACLGAAFSKFLPLVGLTVLVWLIVFVFMIPVGLLMVPFVAFASGVGGLVAVLAVGFGALVVMSIVLVRYFVASPGIVVEQFGVTKSMQESARLTAGHRLSIFALVILLGLFNLMLTWVLQRAVDGVLAQTLLGLAAQALLTSPLQACGAAVAYQRLKMAKDGVDVRSLARVFD